MMQSFIFYAYLILDLGFGLFYGVSLVPLKVFLEFGELQNHMSDLTNFWTWLML